MTCIYDLYIPKAANLLHNYIYVAYVIYKVLGISKLTFLYI